MKYTVLVTRTAIMPIAVDAETAPIAIARAQDEISRLGEEVFRDASWEHAYEAYPWLPKSGRTSSPVQDIIEDEAAGGGSR